MRESMEEVYELFTSKAATGRKMEHAELKKLAGGRVYTGQQAVDVKLADEIGTLQDAIEKARKLGGIAEGTTFDLYNLPEPPNPLEMFLGPMEVSSPTKTPGMQADYLIKQISTLLPADARKILAANWFFELMSKEQKVLTMPYVIELK
jgi:protease-4